MAHAAKHALDFLNDDEDEIELFKMVVQAFQLLDLEDEAGPSNQPPRRVFDRAVIRRDREAAAELLYNDYFADPPLWPPVPFFKRRFRMSRRLFLRIVKGLKTASLTSNKPYIYYFRERPDCTGRDSFTVLQKVASAVKQLAYGTAADTLDEYLRMAESTSLECLDNFCSAIFSMYASTYMRRPTATDIARLYSAHEEKHGFPGMLGSIDCMHWQWKNCPVAWQAQYGRGDKPGPTLMLEAVASYDLWIWHAFFGMAGSNNDINVLNASPLFNEMKDGTAPPSPFVVNGRHYDRGYYLADGIYPPWACLVKAPRSPIDEKRQKFKKYQESARKDVERAFGVLQARWHILTTPARTHDINKMTRIMYCCIILHNMIVEDNDYAIGSSEEEFLQDSENTPRRHPVSQRVSQATGAEIRDKLTHDNLTRDLTEHIWRLPSDFRNRD